MSDISVHVRIGPRLNIFALNKSELTQVSGYFRRALRSSNGPVDLPHESVETFSMFEDWLRARKNPSMLQSDHLQLEPWLSRSSRACVLAQHLDCEEFSKFCLRVFINNIERGPTKPWEYIEAHAEPRSPLRRFSNHWVSWVSFASDPRHVDAPWSMLKGVERVYENPVDPRAYSLDHWYTRCSDTVAQACEHLPAAAPGAQVPEDSRRDEWVGLVSRYTLCGRRSRAVATVSSWMTNAPLKRGPSGNLPHAFSN
jgi:hypothetical protein